MNYVEEIKMKNSQEIDAVIKYDRQRERQNRKITAGRDEGTDLDEIKAKFQHLYKALR